MVRYEMLMLTVPEITSDESSALEAQCETVLREYAATLLSFERWGKYRIAYPVRDNEYGVYFLMRFEVTDERAQGLLADIKTLISVKNNELVMRFLMSRLNVRSALAYHRPESLEEVPTRDVDTFLKESKMTGLLDAKGRGRRPEQRVVAPKEEELFAEESSVTEV